MIGYLYAIKINLNTRFETAVIAILKKHNVSVYKRIQRMQNYIPVEHEVQFECMVAGHEYENLVKDLEADEDIYVTIMH